MKPQNDMPKPKKNQICFTVEQEEWELLQRCSQRDYDGLVTPTALVRGLLRTAMAEGKFD